jgi:hypothetical protein
MKTIELKKRLGSRWDYYATDWDKYKLDSEIKESNYKVIKMILIFYALFCLVLSFLAIINGLTN